MKNRIQLFISSLLSLTLIVLMTSCGDDDPKQEVIEFYSISGNVTYPGGAADGAVVFLAASDVATTSFIASTVANASGAYSFGNLTAGNYFVFANYNTANVNNGRIDGVNFDSGEGYLLEVVDVGVTQNITLVGIESDVQFSVNTTVASDDPNYWGKDLSHSNVDFSFPYDGANATYTGRFNAFDADVIFDASNLAGSSIEASVDLLSISTSSPGGRDSYFDATIDAWNYGCTGGTFGVLDVDGNPVADGGGLPDESTRYATFKSSSIEAYGDGFMATGTFSLNGNSSTETMFFRFINGFEGTNRSGDLVRFSSFDAQLEFAALADYAIESSHVKDGYVTVDISFQVTHLVQ